MDGLTLQQLDDLRDWLQNEMDRDAQARNSAVHSARWKALNDVLAHLDELLADVVTVSLVDPSEGQGA